MQTKAEKTRQFIIERSALVFNIKGYSATSLTDIMECTGLTKGSIYGNFKDKEEVATEVFKYKMDRLFKNLDMYAGKETRYIDKLISITTYYRQNWTAIKERGGCPILNASVEADDHLDYLQPLIRKSIARYNTYISELIKNGQKIGEIKKNVESKKAAFHILTLLEGGILLSKILNTKTHIIHSLEQIEIYINNELKKTR